MRMLTKWTAAVAAAALWTGRNQAILFKAGVAYETGSTLHALGELEFFLIPTPSALTAGLGMPLLIGARRRVRAA